MTLRLKSGENTHTYATERQVTTTAFLEQHAAFTLEQAARAFGPKATRRATLERLRYHVAAGRLRPVARGVYARVPPGADPKTFRPDPFLVAAALRPDAVFSHHAALTLLGAAHSEWRVVTLYTVSRRPPLRLDGTRVEFLGHAAPLVRAGKTQLGVRSVDRSGQSLRVTGPERTLLDGFRRPDLMGGVEELVESAAGFGVLEVDLLRRLLQAYGDKGLYAAAGWFLERHQKTFYVPDEFLRWLEKRRPRSPQYLLRGQRGGKLTQRWNFILPDSVARAGEPDER